MCGAVPMPSPRAARMQPTMPLYAWDEKAPGAVWAADVPLPCHRSARLTEPGPSFSKPPTVVHAARAGQATAGWEMSCAAGSNGVGWMRHLVPFHRSARIIPPERVGVGWMRHLVPFHRSARVPWSDPPTARHADGPVQSTLGKEAN